MVIVDRLTKIFHYEAVIKKLTAENFTEIIIDSVVRYHGLPNFIVRDQGSLFTLQFWSSLCYFMNIKRRFSTGFHLQTDGQTEHQNSTMEAYFHFFVLIEPNNWVQYLPMVEFVFNNSKHFSIELILFELNCGYHLKMSYEDESDPRSRFKTTGNKVAKFRELMDLCKANFKNA